MCCCCYEIIFICMNWLLENQFVNDLKHLHRFSVLVWFGSVYLRHSFGSPPEWAKWTSKEVFKMFQLEFIISLIFPLSITTPQPCPAKYTALVIHYSNVCYTQCSFLVVSIRRMNGNQRSNSIHLIHLEFRERTFVLMESLSFYFTET